MLELPPYRTPQVGKIIVRSILDRTLFVLGRAITVAAPAGAIIWLMANVSIHNISLLAYCTEFLDPFAKWFGLDGTILMALILGFPANEIVMPIMLMAYTATGNLAEISNLSELYQILLQNGWTMTTAICTMMIFLVHFPCSTTCLTIYKETKSIKWTVLAILLPTIIGLGICFIINSIMNLIRLF